MLKNHFSPPKAHPGPTCGRTVNFRSGRTPRECGHHKTQTWSIVILLMEEILHQSIGSLSHYLQGFVHPKWCRISSVNSSVHSSIQYRKTGMGPFFLRHVAECFPVYFLVFFERFFPCRTTRRRSSSSLFRIRRHWIPTHR